MKINPLYALISTIALILLWALATSGKTHQIRTEAKKVLTKDSFEIHVENIEKQLAESDTTIVFLADKISNTERLVKENQMLKYELKKVSDSFNAAKKMLKKRTFIQKVLGINKDTIQTQMKDTTN